MCVCVCVCVCTCSQVAEVTEIKSSLAQLPCLLIDRNETFHEFQTKQNLSFEKWARNIQNPPGADAFEFGAYHSEAHFSC